MFGRFKKPVALIPLSRLQPPGLPGAVSRRRIKFARGPEASIQEYDPQDFELIAGHGYLPELVFAGEATYRRILRECRIAEKNGGITSEMKWLGTFYSEQIRTHALADVSIRWIDETLGYGLFAEQDIEAGGYIGEYTGVVRRRSLFFRDHNEYCFSYPTSDVSYRKHIIDAKEQGNELRYANHSQDPNCEPRCVLLDGILHIIVRAIKDISAGVQITYDYSHHFWQSRTPVAN
jgi:hypothetical protein